MKIDKIKLMAPSLEMKNRVMAFRGEYLAHGAASISGSGGLHRFGQFEDWLNFIRQAATGHVPDRLPSTTFLGVRLTDGAVVGSVNIRHYLTENVYHNGHIGYSVRPLERRKGYGTELLRLALIKAEQLGIIETVVTCHKTNQASKRVIQKNGLVLEREFTEEDGNIILIFKKPL